MWRPCILWSRPPLEEVAGRLTDLESNWDQWVGGEKHERQGVCVARQVATQVAPHGMRPFLQLGMGKGAYDLASWMDALF